MKGKGPLGTCCERALVPQELLYAGQAPPDGVLPTVQFHSQLQVALDTAPVQGPVPLGWCHRVPCTASRRTSCLQPYCTCIWPHPFCLRVSAGGDGLLSPIMPCPGEHRSIILVLSQSLPQPGTTSPRDRLLCANDCIGRAAAFVLTTLRP